MPRAERAADPFQAIPFRRTLALPEPQSIELAYCYRFGFIATNYGHKNDHRMSIVSADPFELQRKATGVFKRNSRRLYIVEAPILLWRAAEKHLAIFSPSWSRTNLLFDRVTRCNFAWHQELLDELCVLKIDSNEIPKLLSRKYIRYERSSGKWFPIPYSEPDSKYEESDSEVTHIRNFVLRWQSRKKTLPPCLMEYFNGRQLR